MRITRSQSMIFAIGVIALFFVLATVLSGRQKTTISTNLPQIQEELPPTPTPSTDDINSKFVLNNFHRSETKNGRTLWEVQAVKGQYFPADNTALVHDATLQLFRKNGDVVKVLTGQALLHLSGPALTRADASRGVTIIYNDGTTLKTESAVYDRATGNLTAPGLVTINSQRADITGNRLDGNLEKNEFVLADEVSTVIRPKEHGSDKQSSKLPKI